MMSRSLFLLSLRSAVCKSSAKVGRYLEFEVAPAFAAELRGRVPLKSCVYVCVLTQVVVVVGAPRRTVPVTARKGPSLE